MNNNGDKQGDVICSVVFFILLIPLPLALIGHWLIASVLFIGAAIYVVTNPAFVKDDKPNFVDSLRHSNDRATKYMNSRSVEPDPQNKVA